MSGRVRQRASANTEKAMNPMNTNERILRVNIKIHQLVLTTFLENFNIIIT